MIIGLISGLTLWGCGFWFGKNYGRSLAERKEAQWLMTNLSKWGRRNATR